MRAFPCPQLLCPVSCPANHPSTPPPALLSEIAPHRRPGLSNWRMGRGVSSGGGQSSLGYLFGGGEAPKPAVENAEPVRRPAPIVENAEPVRKPAPAPAPTPAPAPADNGKQIPAGVPAKTTNNYFRADGQNCGNFITDRPSTKVHAAPGGGSSLDYLFGAPSGGN